MVKFQVLSSLWLGVLLIVVNEARGTNIFLDGRSVIVQLFSWKWTDIKKECVNFLGPHGYAAVQVSPPNEHVLIWEPAMNTAIRRPWWEMYQPVSYKLHSRTGDMAKFVDMVKTCNKAGVRIIVDAVINHMSGVFPEGTPATGGSSFSSETESYPTVPYTKEHFGDKLCSTSSGDIENYDDPDQVRNCKLVGLNDLDHRSAHVVNSIADYMNNLIDLGVAGFRIDAAKHIWPQGLKAIKHKLKHLSTYAGFEPQTSALIYQEVIPSATINSDEYFPVGMVTEFKYGSHLARCFRREDSIKWLSNFGEAWGMVPSEEALVFLDNHDTQRDHSNKVLTFRDAKLYKMAQAFSLAWPYGMVRVMSSYYWDKIVHNNEDVNNWVGAPHDENYNILDVVTYPDLSCGNNWICEHRWRQVYNMVKFKQVVEGEPVTNWWSGTPHQIAFCRGNKGFIVINNDLRKIDAELQTCLPAGIYCDVISGNYTTDQCQGKAIPVNESGFAKININPDEFDGVLAIHAGSRLT